MQDHLDNLIQQIQVWRKSHDMPQNEHGHLLLITDSEEFNNLFSDPNNSEKVMMTTRCPKFGHSVQNPIPDVSTDEAQTIKIGNASIIFSVEPLNK